MERSFTSFFRSTLSFAIFGCLFPLTAEAQISADGTTSTTVNQNGNDFTIDQGDRIGDNLFHSFNEFSVPTQGSAAFNNAGDIANIFSRVTGSSISSIDGLLSANGTANLYLINPNGIIFGQNARLDLGGSFFASTADSLLFEGNNEFSASNPQAPPLLEVSIPIGASFRDNPGDITNLSFAQNSAGDFAGLEVDTGKNLTLLGGSINFETGRATTRGGNIKLGGLSEAGTVILNEDGSLIFPENIARSDIFLSNAIVEVSGSSGGNIQIEGSQLDVTEGSLIFSNTLGTEAGGDVILRTAEEITVSDSALIIVSVLGSGLGGNVRIETGQLIMQDGGEVGTSTFDTGNAGDLIVRASAIEITGTTIDGQFPSGLFSQVRGTGDAGDVIIDTERLIVSDGGQLLSDNIPNSEGQGGTLNIQASKSVKLVGGITPFPTAISVDSRGAGNGGDLIIETGQLIIQNGAQVSAAALGLGNGGSLIIRASEVEVAGRTTNAQFPSGLITSVQRGATGKGGQLTLEAERLVVKDGAEISTATFGVGDAQNLTIMTEQLIIDDAKVSAQTTGAGDAGNLTIDTRQLIVQNSSEISAQTTGIGKAGMLNIDATDSAEITGTSGLFVSGINGGTAGNLTLSTRELTIANGASVTVSSTQGQAGNLNITANSLFQNQAEITAETGISEGNIGANINLEISDIWRIENGSQVSATAFGDADGGNININQDISDTEFLLFAFPPTDSGGSDITANAEQGNGGRIDITAAGVFGIDFRDISPEEAQSNSLNDFSVSSQFGTSGETIINTPEVDPTSGLINLPASVGDASDQISQNPCEQGVGSEFTITGKGGLPPNVNESLNSESAQVGLIEPLPQPLSYTDKGARIKGNGIPIENLASEAVPAMGWMFNNQGEVTLTAYSTSDEEFKRSEQQHQTTCKSGITH